MTATLDALVAENRDLRRELNHQQERLRAIERSRWWRLHPRRLLRKANVDGAKQVAHTEASPPNVAPRAESPRSQNDPALARFGDEVVGRGSFTEDWVTPRFAPWRPIFEALEGRPTRILEIGSYEGLSACFFIWRLPQARLTCIDTFAGMSEGVPEQAGKPSRDLEAVFDANVALVDASRVTKLVGDSKHRLLELSAGAEQFDLVYIDGSHLGLDVLVDAALSWNLLSAGGALVFDDYQFAYLGEDPLLRPGKAIDAFRELVAAKHEVVFANDQIALRRIS